VKGSPSKTRKGDMDYTTKKGDKYYHRGKHEESESESDTDSESGKPFEGGSLKKKRPHLIKGSEEAKKFMAEMRAKRKGKAKMTGKGVSNNSPQADHVRVSPYQNF
jgi:hypothetical protein